MKIGAGLAGEPSGRLNIVVFDSLIPMRIYIFCLTAQIY